MRDPREPQAAGLYHGWRVIAALFVVGMMVYGAGLYAFTLFIPPLSAEFGWSRAATGGLVSVFWLAAPLTVFGGYMNRRFGAFKLIVWGVVLEAACLALVGLVDSLTAMYVVRALMGVGKIMMAAGVTTEASKWFRHRFGLAIALAFAGWHFGGVALAPLTQYLIDAFGWRITCFTLSGLTIVLGLPLVALWARGKGPADLGLAVDGYRAGHADPAHAAPGAHATEATVSLGEIMRGRAFWLIVLLTILGAYAYGALVTHEVALLASAGVPSTMAASALAMTAGFAIVGALALGHLCDRWPFKAVMALELLLMAGGVAGFLALLHVESMALLFVSACIFGMAIGGFDTCIVAHLGKRFPAGLFSHVYGLWYFFYLATLFIGPIIAGGIYDLTRHYDEALLVMLGALAAAFAALLAFPERGKALVVRHA